MQNQDGKKDVDLIVNRLDSLQDSIKDINSRLETLEKRSEEERERVHTSVKPVESSKAAYSKGYRPSGQDFPLKKSSDISVGGLVLLIIGILLSMSIIGGIIGIPLIIIGIVLLTRKSRDQKETVSDMSAAKAGYKRIISEDKIKNEEVNKDVDDVVYPVPKHFDEKDFDEDWDEEWEVENADEKESLPPGMTVKAIESKKMGGQFKVSESLEQNIALKWFTVIGVTALVIGVGFFIKYAVENNWIDHLTRIVLGFVFGTSLVIVGEYASRKKKFVRWGRSLVGGGFAIMYFAVYSAYHFVEYREAIGISLGLNMILLIVVGAGALTYSLMKNSRIVASEAFFFGYLTAILGGSFEILTLFYSFILTISIITVSLIKKWSLIGVGGVVGSYLLYFIWTLDAEPSFAMKSLSLITYFAIFLFQSSFIALKQKDKERIAITSLLLNTGFFTMFYWIAIDSYNPDIIKYFLGAISLVYFSIYLLVRSKSKAIFSHIILYLTIFFFTLNIPYLVDRSSPWITIILGVELVGLVYAFLKTKESPFKISAHVLIFIILIKIFTHDVLSYNEFRMGDILSSTRFFLFLGMAGIFYLLNYLAKRKKNVFSDEEQFIPDVYAFLGSGLLIASYLIEYETSWSTVFGNVVILGLVLVYLKSKDSSYKISAVVAAGLLVLKIFAYDVYNYDKLDFSNFFSSDRFFLLLLTTAVFYLVNNLLKKKKVDSSETGSLIDVSSKPPYMESTKKNNHIKNSNVLNIFPVDNKIGMYFVLGGTACLIASFVLEAEYFLSSIMGALVIFGLLLAYLKNREAGYKYSFYAATIFLSLKYIVYDSINYQALKSEGFIFRMTFDSFEISDFFTSTRFFSLLILILVFYLGAYVINHRQALFKVNDVSMADYYIAFGNFAFFTLIPIEFTDIWVSVLWLLLALSFMFFYLKTRKLSFRIASYAVSAIVAVKILTYDLLNLEEYQSGNLFGSKRAIIFILGTLAFYAISSLISKKKELFPKVERKMANVYIWVGSIFLFILVLIEAKSFWISILWTFLAAILLLVGFRLKNRTLRFQGLIIFGITIFKVFLVDTLELDTIYRTLSFIVLGIILLSISFVYSKYKDRLKDIL